MTKPIRPKDTRYRVYWSCSNCGKTGVSTIVTQATWWWIERKIEGSHFGSIAESKCHPYEMNIQRIVRVFKKRKATK